MNAKVEKLLTQLANLGAKVRRVDEPRFHAWIVDYWYTSNITGTRELHVGYCFTAKDLSRFVDEIMDIRTGNHAPYAPVVLV